MAFEELSHFAGGNVGRTRNLVGVGGAGQGYLSGIQYHVALEVEFGAFDGPELPDPGRH